MFLHLNSTLEQDVEKMPELHISALEAARDIAAIAVATAPRVDGDYVAGIGVQETKAGARVFASDEKSAFVEFGIPSRGVPAQFILRRAAEAAGYKFKKRR